MLTNLICILKATLYSFTHILHISCSSHLASTYTTGAVYTWAPHPWIQPTLDQKYSEKKMNQNFSESSKKQNLFYCEGNICIAFTLCSILQGFPGGAVVQTLPCNARDRRSPGVGTDNPPQYSCLEFHGQRSLTGYRPWGRRESNMTEHNSKHKILQVL